MIRFSNNGKFWVGVFSRCRRLSRGVTHIFVFTDELDVRQGEYYRYECIEAERTTLSDYDIRLASQRSGLPPHIIQQLFEAFMERAGRDGRMTVSEFKRAYLEINPSANVLNLDNDAERVFMIFDADQNGVLTFDEFMIAYILLQRGGLDPSNRWQVALNSMPAGMISRPGLINAAEAQILLQRMNQFYQIPNFDPSQQHVLLWNQVTPRLDPNGYISQPDFLNMLAAQPHIQPHIW